MQKPQWEAHFEDADAHTAGGGTVVFLAHFVDGSGDADTARVSLLDHLQT
jgi:hypothetical protein